MLDFIGFFKQKNVLPTQIERTFHILIKTFSLFLCRETSHQFLAEAFSSDSPKVAFGRSLRLRRRSR